MIDFDEDDGRHTWADVADCDSIGNHDPGGDTLDGILLVVHPEYRNMRVGRWLYEARQELARRLNLRRIMVGGRLPGYERHADEMSVREYVERVRKAQICDPVRSFQLANGFTVKRIDRDYLPSAEASHGYAKPL